MRAMTVVVLCLLTAAALGDPATAKKHNNAGMKAYAKHDFEAAKGHFEKAIAEDPTFVKAHYNRASMAALLHDLDVMREEFTWLKASKDPEAARVLAKAKTDADFRGVSLLDDARAILGHAPVADTPLDQLLLGYGGRWAGVDEGMMEGWVEMTFASKGKVKGRDHSGETATWYRWSGTWKVDGRKLVLTRGKEKSTYELKDCTDRTDLEGALCLVHEDGGIFLSPGTH